MRRHSPVLLTPASLCNNSATPLGTGLRDKALNDWRLRKGELENENAGCSMRGNKSEVIAEASNWLAWTYLVSKHAQAYHPHVLVRYDL